MEGPQPSPAPPLIPPAILSSSSGLESLSLLLSPLAQPQRRRERGAEAEGATVGQSVPINRLLEFIAVSSCAGEEPRGLGDREEGTSSIIFINPHPPRWLYSPPIRFTSPASLFCRLKPEMCQEHLLSHGAKRGINESECKRSYLRF